MALPRFEDGWLIPGHHTTTWEEIESVFGGEPGSKRAQVLAHLLDFRKRTKEHGISGRLLLNGSFISAKTEPGDFDCLLIYDEATENLMNSTPDIANILKYGYWKDQGYGDVFIFSEAAVLKYPTMCRLDMFDTEKHTGKLKGLVEVLL